MSPQGKKTFAMIDYEKCDPRQCDPENGKCPAVEACPHKVIKQLDGVFEQPMIFQDLCQGCWECIEACPLEAIHIKEIGS
ncbi:MAG: 4Fe-4S binding protein [Desulfobacterales bacterium]|nr:4Fe-4S binding protein [Desulfobacterales bacterium]